MSIVVLGWGSLVTDKARNDRCGLYIKGGWYKGGPTLPVEFTRKSKSTVDKNVVNRLTLVIDERGPLLPVHWAVMEEESLERCHQILAQREGTSMIGCLDTRRRFEYNSGKEQAIGAWIRDCQSITRHIDGVVWTSLPSNIDSPLLDNVVAFIERLEDRTEAEMYVKKAPVDIITPVRTMLEDKYGWLSLPASLYEP